MSDDEGSATGAPEQAAELLDHARRAQAEAGDRLVAAKLAGGQFRWLNQQLYSTTGKEALTMMQKQPELFEMYHEGFRKQTAGWSDNPVDHVVSWLRKQDWSWTVADFGCGEAKLAQALPNRKIHSFDLVKHNDFVTVANCAEVPLKKCSVHVAVFCLALMGTDWPSFIKEAHRCLCRGGILEIYEVTSRVQDATAFTKLICALGFKNVRLAGAENKSNKFFTHLRFSRKGGKPLRTGDQENAANSRMSSEGVVPTDRTGADQEGRARVMSAPPTVAEMEDDTAMLSKSSKRRLRRENALFKQTKEYRAQVVLAQRKRVKKEQLRKTRHERAAANAINQQSSESKFRIGSKKRRLIRDLRAQGKHQEVDTLLGPLASAVAPTGELQPNADRGALQRAVPKSRKRSTHVLAPGHAAGAAKATAPGATARAAKLRQPLHVKKAKNMHKGRGEVDSSVLGACVYKRR
mmetsp:Transcript_74224/g.170075  ORF Transcript_74224/g.170075 Transcript_74224/m.170075 type:complete len:464 (-) Transcript_74224:18-1409(-)